MTSKASQATSTSAITIVEKEFPAVKNVRKWDARGALLGHPGPSPPFDVSSVKSTPSGEATQRQDETSAETSTVIPGEGFEDYGERVQIFDKRRNGSSSYGNVSYVVRAIIQESLSDQKDSTTRKYLMIQESKESCREKWYLPAGTVHHKESLDEAAVRIVKEESGIIAKSSSVLMVEEIGPFWLRFTFTMECFDGDLKSVEDSFSMRSQFLTEDVIRTMASKDQLRDVDMLRALNVARKVKRKLPKIDSALGNYKWNMLKIQDIPHKFISIRACFVFKNDESKYWILQNRKTLGLPNLPGWGALDQKCLHAIVFKFLVGVFKKENLHWYSYKTMGVTCVEHKKAESPHDPQGLRLTVLFRILKDEHAAARKQKNDYPDVKSNTYVWEELNDISSAEALSEIFKSPNILPPLHSPVLIKIGYAANDQYQSLIHLDTWHSNPLFSTSYGKGKKTL